ncbi:hypothetical protein AJ85_08690 [Alkalihalobacillus alcalophilus ATCC 27647 = CGMCC 1.3604]|uniref:CxxH/CxxC protein n=2 Tax=Alkalihalobacillus alcalophilus TaxID=1445 RepID=A0A4S4JZV1_ALKAL|nr:hypothetical protein AJ85_08690 [Alkalihalobacillus alcalophilus ATCC 27647 = CGMCC 1.3604]
MEEVPVDKNILEVSTSKIRICYNKKRIKEGTDKMKLMACQEHVELAMEMIIDEKEVAPNIEILTKDQDLSTVCEFCQNEAKYSVSNQQ